jgi:hypothetical protein
MRTRGGLSVSSSNQERPQSHKADDEAHIDNYGET